MADSTHAMVPVCMCYYIQRIDVEMTPHNIHEVRLDYNYIPTLCRSVNV